MRGGWAGGWMVWLLVACGPTREADPMLAAARQMPLRPEEVLLDATRLAARVDGVLLPPVPHRPDVTPIVNGEPARLRFRFDSDSLASPVDIRQRQLLVYPVEAYRELLPAGARIALDTRLAELRRLLRERPEFADSSEIPVLPVVETPQVLRARVRYVDFAGGGGVSFIARYSPGYGAAADSLVWTFQGLTDDGRYYVSIFHPISAPSFPETGRPLDTVYYLDALRTSEFTPDPDVLDGLAGSIRIARRPQPISNGEPQ